MLYPVGTLSLESSLEQCIREAKQLQANKLFGLLQLVQIQVIEERCTDCLDRLLKCKNEYVKAKEKPDVKTS